ncbi:MAG: hypothetical protein Phyf2KO_04470 [Phycisphaerales bacterium]
MTHPDLGLAYPGCVCNPDSEPVSGIWAAYDRAPRDATAGIASAGQTLDDRDGRRRRNADPPLLSTKRYHALTSSFLIGWRLQVAAGVRYRTR